MTKVTEEMLEALRRGASECVSEGVNGWGNTMSAAADFLESMTAAQDTDDQLVADICSLLECGPDHIMERLAGIAANLPEPNAVQVDREDYNLAALKEECEGLSLFRYVDGQLVDLIDEDFDKLAESILSTEGK